MSPRWSDAPCNGRTSLFFSFKFEEIDEAIDLCKTCPHIEPCRESSIGEHDGVWAGELKGWASSLTKKRYTAWKKKQMEAQEVLLKQAEQLGIDVELFRRAAGH